jgi:tetratricopeptide (TPR) repeat protein
MQRSGIRPSLTFLFLTLVFACSEDNRGADGPSSSSDDYLGRYKLSEDVVLVVNNEEGLLTLLPSFWRTTQILEPVGSDHFRSLLHPEIEFQFFRDQTNHVSEVIVSGHREISGRATRLDEVDSLPVELLLAGNSEQALKHLEDQGSLDSPDRALRLGHKLMANFQSRSDAARRFFERLTELFPESAQVQLATGDALVLAGRRDEAFSAYRRALVLNPKLSEARTALGRLDDAYARPDAVWRVPFVLADLFRPPTSEEIATVHRDWAARNLIPHDVSDVATHVLDLPHGRFTARVVSHRVHGSLHYGAILIPDGATVGCCPVVLDLRGIGWDYPPLDITNGIRTTQVLREDANGFIFAVPSFRGEVLRVDQVSYNSEGDRTDGWDGAADDAIALLSVVINRVPEADTDRVCVYGKSRGGTVALLVGARDPRVTCVVDWAGPVDWFEQMGTYGWTLEEQVADGLREGWKPGEGEGSAAQFIERYLKQSIENGNSDVGGIRLRMLASSPLYFSDQLPVSNLHYGLEDRSVPAVNGRVLARRLEGRGASAPPFTIQLHDGAGHDMPYPAAHDRSRAFLMQHLLARAVR